VAVIIAVAEVLIVHATQEAVTETGMSGVTGLSRFHQKLPFILEIPDSILF
jgi:hypothetical protein